MNKKYTPPLFVIVAALALGACTTPPYVAPQSGNTAEMVVRIQPARGTLFYLNTFDNAESCSGEKTIVSDTNRISVSKFKFATEKLTTLQYMEMQGGANCIMKFSFFGKANHVYVLDSLTTTGKCSIKLRDATDMKNLVPVPTIDRYNGDNVCPNFKG